MGRFRSTSRGDKTPDDSTRKTTSTSSGNDPGQDRSQSWSKTPVFRAARERLDGDQRSRERETASGSMADTQGDKSMATIGRSIVFKGELTGDEDLEIDGQVEGTVNLKNHQLTIGANGNLKAEVTAKSIIVIGQVKGNLTAAEGIEVQATGVVEGDVCAPRLNVQEGAVLNGSIDMSASIVSDAKKPVSQSSASASAPPSISTSTTAPA